MGSCFKPSSAGHSNVNWVMQFKTFLVKGSRQKIVFMLGWRLDFPFLVELKHWSNIRNHALWDWFRISLNSIWGNYFLWHLQVGKLFWRFQNFMYWFWPYFDKKGEYYSKENFRQGRILTKEIWYAINQLLYDTASKHLNRRCVSSGLLYKLLNLETPKLINFLWPQSYPCSILSNACIELECWRTGWSTHPERMMDVSDIQ